MAKLVYFDQEGNKKHIDFSMWSLFKIYLLLYILSTLVIAGILMGLGFSVS